MKDKSLFIRIDDRKLLHNIGVARATCRYINKVALEIFTELGIDLDLDNIKKYCFENGEEDLLNDLCGGGKSIQSKVVVSWVKKILKELKFRPMEENEKKGLDLIKKGKVFVYDYIWEEGEKRREVEGFVPDEKKLEEFSKIYLSEKNAEIFKKHQKLCDAINEFKGGLDAVKYDVMDILFDYDEKGNIIPNIYSIDDEYYKQFKK